MTDVSALSSGRVMTVRGLVEPTEIGATMMHEHFFLDLSRFWEPGHAGQFAGTEPFTADVAALARWDTIAFRENMVLSPTQDYELLRAEVAALQDAAPQACLVELSSAGIMSDPDAVLRLATELDVHIVTGAGWYVHAVHDAQVESATVEELTDELYRQVQDGILGTRVRPGILGELGTSEVLQPCEEKVLRAGARVAQRSGLAVNVHCEPPTVDVVHQILDVLADEGHDLTRTYLSHLDEIGDIDYHLSVLDRGVVIGFDSFGQDGYFAASWKSRSDLAKMTTAAALIKKGYGNQLVLAQDISRKHMLHALGGFGYDHVLRRVVPRMQELFGIDDATVQAMLVGTPRRLLTIA
jgi:phosphotriesterase-related protein